MNTAHHRVKYRQLLADLDSKGVHVNIQRVAKKNYIVYQNFTIVAEYKTRKTCNKYLIKIHLKNL